MIALMIVETGALVSIILTIWLIITIIQKLSSKGDGSYTLQQPIIKKVEPELTPEEIAIRTKRGFRNELLKLNADILLQLKFGYFKIGDDKYNECIERKNQLEKEFTKPELKGINEVINRLKSQHKGENIE